KLFHFIPNGKIKNLLKYSFLGFSQRLGFFRQTLPGIPEDIEWLFRRNPINYRIFPPVRFKDIVTFDRILNSNGIPYLFKFYKREPKKRSMLKTIEARKKNFDVFIYSIGLCDSLGHKYGPEPTRFRENIEKLETVITDAYHILSKEYDTSLVVFSDHGMTQINKFLNLEEQMREFKLGQDFLVFLDSTMARFWFFNETVQDRIIDLLENCKHGSILTGHELKRYGLDFKDNRYGELIFVTKPGTVIYPSFMGRPLLSQQSTDRGMHGYVPEEPSTYGIFMCNSDVDLELGRSTHVTHILSLLLKILGNKMHED
ncbi:MAG: alkaline phosphatase family protein, partial [Candidatus Baldrarchaeia archaeon]